MATETIPDLLAAGTAFADVSSWRKVSVSGADALEWLDDLVTADLSDLAPGRGRPALFLSPTGGLRASFTVALVSETPLLLQDPSQPAPIQALLEPYVLSSDVALEDRTAALAMVAVPGRTEVPDAPGATHSTPSCLGMGLDLISAADDRESMIRWLSKTCVQASEGDVEAWRIAAGIPRFGVDATEGDLPQESGMYGAVSRSKGCFPGQEAVAKVDTMGHPRRVVVALVGDGPAVPGDCVMDDGSEVGRITSATVSGGRTLVLARLRWKRNEASLHTNRGTQLRSRSL